MSTPDDAAVPAPTHVYRHPDGYGLGRHHAGQDLSGRPSVPGIPLDDLMPDARVSMHDLDLQHGTAVTLAEFDGERGLHLVGWTDAMGTPRRTSITPEDLAAFFQEA
jgi:hypothetical protein